MNKTLLGRADALIARRGYITARTDIAIAVQVQMRHHREYNAERADVLFNILIVHGTLNVHYPYERTHTHVATSL